MASVSACSGQKALEQWSPSFMARGTGFKEDNLSMDQGRGTVSG